MRAATLHTDTVALLRWPVGVVACLERVCCVLAAAARALESGSLFLVSPAVVQGSAASVSKVLQCCQMRVKVVQGLCKPVDQQLSVGRLRRATLLMHQVA